MDGTLSWKGNDEGVGTLTNTGGVELSDFFSHGMANGDSCVVNHYDSENTPLWTVGRAVSFLNQNYTSIFLNNNGMFSFGSGTSNPSTSATCGTWTIPLISIYSAHNHHGMEPGSGLAGDVCFRRTQDPQLLLKAQSEIRKGFSDFGQALTHLVIATWLRVPPYRRCNTMLNTFQLVLAIGAGGETYAIMYYERLEYHLWQTCSNTDPGLYCFAGISGGSGGLFYPLPTSCSINSTSLVARSNINEAGKFVFRVNREIEHPTFTPTTTTRPTTTTSTTTRPTTTTSTTTRPTTTTSTTTRPTTTTSTTTTPTTTTPTTTTPTTTTLTTTNPTTTTPTTTTVPSSDFVCTAEGTFRDPCMCNMFHSCVFLGVGYQHNVFVCPSNLVFCENLGYCDHEPVCPCPVPACP
ncbi:uncharacterized protein LOC118438974 [Folsomia candida]|uniref:uncharacterized protein LOC118438974 n=1 Tax=Folsomia candida TaxID=158441 RepID=UPI001604D51D|nr:uncharacterized protein LOC118438974 [Folsomia candida]